VERGDECAVLPNGQLRRALLRLNDWVTKPQADWMIAEVRRSDSGGFDPQSTRVQAPDP